MVDNANLIDATGIIVTAYVSSHNVPGGDLVSIINVVAKALAATNAERNDGAINRPVPRMAISKTITPDALISLEDGRSYRTLKRHLATRGMTPDQYREKWGLPSDYPMVAANYANVRAEMARRMGLGQKRSAPAPLPAPVPIPEPKRRGRPRKSASQD